jgi:hypothetical protein
MARIRELQPAHHSDKVTVEQAARAFRKVRMRRLGLIEASTSSNGHARRDENGHSTECEADSDRPATPGDEIQQ